ncbi:hypothetical protein BAY61_01520 [Prauserella marina]|uniref:Uncharacterized protein n=1 Tax=Prauserella marina TaxID=530584 RepID=A0A222VJ21_9PSEU|nr:hypothetical protein [Prauserella marina]ASR33884.1 hypothetical protein BAY61_01520 [Prauserella marina]PWV82479.1 hypothetical protein DES30_102722 [Prauserella marina]SDC70173.1 hypothetical protein SAMN05421630_103258 [Prauserella marina]
MVDRAGKSSLARRLILSLVALTFAATAALQLMLARSMTEWWPVPVAVALTLAAIGCGFAAARPSRDVDEKQPH